MYTSLKLSKLLAENGCGLKSEMSWMKFREDEEWELYSGQDRRLSDYSTDEWRKGCETAMRAYDILNDLCCRYAVEVFGFEHWKRDYYHEIPNLQEWRTKPQHVLELLQQGKQDEAEAYLWKHCLYNPKNK